MVINCKGNDLNNHDPSTGYATILGEQNDKVIMIGCLHIFAIQTSKQTLRNDSAPMFLVLALLNNYNLTRLCAMDVK